MSLLPATRLVFTRALRLSLRNPVWVILGLIQPLLYLALFGPLLERVTTARGFPSADAWRVFVPGLLVQLGIFGAAFVGFGLLAEMRAGVVERMRVTPTPRLALLLGRVVRDILVLLAQATLLVCAALLFGLRVPLGDLVLGLLVVAALGAAFASASYAAALTLRAEDALASVLNGLAADREQHQPPQACRRRGPRPVPRPSRLPLRALGARRRGRPPRRRPLARHPHVPT